METLRLFLFVFGQNKTLGRCRHISTYNTNTKTPALKNSALCLWTVHAQTSWPARMVIRSLRWGRNCELLVHLGVE